MLEVFFMNVNIFDSNTIASSETVGASKEERRQAAEVITQEEGERRFRENNGTEVTIRDGGLPRKVKRVKPCIGTMNEFLKDEVACGMHIAFDSFLEDIFVTDHRKSGAKPEPWDEYRTVPELLTRAERTFGDGINNMPLQGQRSTFEKLFFGMAHQNTFDSAVDRLNSLPKWDGTKRLDAWLVDYCGVKDSDHKGERLLSRYMIIVACARMGNTKRSGIKADILPVFYGEHGKGKSTIVKYLSLLGEDGFFDGLRFDGKKDDTIRDTLGKCICEIRELGGLNNGKKGRNDLKNWITSSTDRMTRKYKKKAVDHPRRYLPVMTTNEQHFLNDPTGNRRFAPVTVAETGEARLDDLQRDMEQIYAEALAVCNGIPTQKDVLDAWRPLDKVLPLMSKKFVEEDVLYRRVLIAAQKLYEGRSYVTIDNIMTSPEGLGWGTDRADNRQARRFADVLRKHGWKCDHKGYYMTDETEIIADDGTERSDGDEPF